MWERFIIAGPLIIGVFNVETGDVVREQHHLIAMKFLTVFLRQSPSLNLLHESDDEVASANKWIDDMNTHI